MTHPEIHSFQSKLDYLFTKLKLLDHDAELLAHWARYLCVLVSGYLEVSIRTIFREYSKSKSSPNVANFVEAKLNAFQNPKMGLILELNGSFSHAWQLDLEKLVKDEIKQSVDSIVNIRNKVAHGQNVGITPSLLKYYYKNAKKLVLLLESQCTC